MKYLIAILLMLAATHIQAQVLEITNLRVSNFNNIKEKVLHESNGPYTLFFCKIKNTTENVLELKPSSAVYKIEFKNAETLYTEEVVPIAFMDNETILLSSGDSIQFSVGTDLFYGADVYKKSQNDYTLDLLLIIPSIKLIYEQPNLRLTSSCINKITLKND